MTTNSKLVVVEVSLSFAIDDAIKADLNKFRHDAQNEVTLTCAKFGRDIFSISNVIGRKTKWPRFFGLPCMWITC